MFASIETLNVIMALKEGRNRLIIVGAFIAPVLGVINSSTEGREWWNWSFYDWMYYLYKSHYIYGGFQGLLYYVGLLVVIWVIYRVAKWVYDGFKN